MTSASRHWNDSTDFGRNVSSDATKRDRYLSFRVAI